MKGSNKTLVFNKEEQETGDGFTLLELIVVVMVIGIVAAIAVPVFLNAQDNARQSAVEASASNAVGPVQEDVLNGITVFGDQLDRLASDENVELTILGDHLTPGDPDTVCVQASWVGSGNTALAGAGCHLTPGDETPVLPPEDDEDEESPPDEEDPGETDPVVTPPEEEEEEEPSGGEVELVWQVQENRNPLGLEIEGNMTGMNVVVPIQGNVSGTINWDTDNDDSEPEPLVGDNPSHTYDEAGTYTITINNARFDTWSAATFHTTRVDNAYLDTFELHSDLSGLKSVSSFEDTGVTSLSAGFAFATNIEEVPDLPESVEDTSWLFARAHFFDQDISDWDTSQVQDMAGMFAAASSFNQDLSEWDVSNVENMYDMFAVTQDFDQDLSVWDVSNVERMTGMFSFTYSFNQDISEWDVSNVRHMDGMFAEARSFNNGDAPGQSNNPLNWDDKLNNVVDMQVLFGSRNPSEGGTPVPFNQDISGWDVSNVRYMDGMFSQARLFNQDLSEWDVSNVRDMSSMFYEARSFNNGDAPGQSNNPLDWNVGNVVDMNYMFASQLDEGSGGLVPFNQDISGWNVSNVKNMMAMFEQASLFNQDIGGWDVSSVENMGWMFYYAYDFNQDLSRWTTGNVESVRGMFYQARSFSQNISNWDVSSINGYENHEGFYSNSGLSHSQVPVQLREY